ncbi:MAG: hypothetical protein LKG25_02205 [Prevotella sp.]|jgi:hypothetical protein|nr:hypothetical protein [Prevotella sp.]MCI1281393.1 hypothetical protein [Prevotella sp.]
MENIDKLCWKYMKQGISLIACLFLIGLFVIQVGDFRSMLTPLIICTAYALILEVVDAQVWKRVAKHAPESMSTFYMGASGFRMLSALAVLFIYYLAYDHSGMLAFFLVFAVFYVTILVHHTAFFRNHTNITK